MRCHYSAFRRNAKYPAADTDLSVLSRQYLDRRLPNKQAEVDEVAGQEDRNKPHQGRLAIRHCGRTRQAGAREPGHMGDSKHQ